MNRVGHRDALCPYYGQATDSYAGLTRDGVLGKWIWQLAEEDAFRWKKLLRSSPVSICVSLSYWTQTYAS